MRRITKYIKSQEVTQKEIICIYGAVLMEALNMPVPAADLFKAAVTERIGDSSLQTTAGNWRNSKDIQKVFEEAKNKLTRYAVKLSESGDDEIKDEVVKKIDFADKDEFINYVTRKANNITDEKQRLDYLKILADIQRFKESKTDEQGEIQRFYTPLQCSSCPLYKAKQNK